MRESSYCFHRILAIAILSIRLSVHLSITRVDQSKAVQAKITKFLPSAARCTELSLCDPDREFGIFYINLA